jgi:hypothetical protein
MEATNHAAPSRLAAKAQALECLQLRMMLSLRLGTLEENLRALITLEDAVSAFSTRYFAAIAEMELVDTTASSHKETAPLVDDFSELEHQRATRAKHLKTSYRTLAKQFHPDRVQASSAQHSVMQAVNDAYARQDLAALTRLELEHSLSSAEVDDAGMMLAEKLARCEQLIGLLSEQRSALEQSPLFELHERELLARMQGRDFIAQVKRSLKNKQRRNLKSAA